MGAEKDVTLERYVGPHHEKTDLRFDLGRGRFQVQQLLPTKYAPTPDGHPRVFSPARLLSFLTQPWFGDKMAV